MADVVVLFPLPMPLLRSLRAFVTAISANMSLLRSFPGATGGLDGEVLGRWPEFSRLVDLPVRGGRQLSGEPCGEEQPEGE